MKRQYLLISKLIVLEMSGVTLFAGCGNSSVPMTPTPTPTSVSVRIEPSGADLHIGYALQFSATLSPSATDKGIAWSVVGTGCSGASCGAIDNMGNYTAPATVPFPNIVTVTARSVADPTKSAAANVNIVTGVVCSFSIDPTSVEFGNQLVNATSAPKALTLTNTCSTPEQIVAGIDDSEGPSDFLQTNDCPSILAVGASCTFRITFRPSATGPRNSVLGIRGRQGTEAQSYAELGGAGTN
jgi:hypothetical protein